MPNADLAAASRPRRRIEVEWVDIDDPDPTFPYTPGETAPTTNDDALNYVGDQGRAQGAARFSRLEGAVYDNGIIYFTLDPGRRPGRARAERHRSQRLGQRQRARSGRTAPAAERLQLRLPVARARHARLPRQRHARSKRGTLVLCEDNVNDNYLRGLTRDGQLFDIALNRLVSTHRRRTASTTSSPGRRSARTAHTLFVNIQASRGHDVRHLGPLGTRSASEPRSQGRRTAEPPEAWKAWLERLIVERDSL